jgi:hypothetical protein
MPLTQNSCVSYQIRMIDGCLCGVRPPVKLGRGTDDRRCPLEFKPALHLSVLPFVQVAAVAIGSCLIRERPQSLGGLQLG